MSLRPPKAALRPPTSPRSPTAPTRGPCGTSAAPAVRRYSCRRRATWARGCLRHWRTPMTPRVLLLSVMVASSQCCRCLRSGCDKTGLLERTRPCAPTSSSLASHPSGLPRLPRASLALCWSRRGQCVLGRAALRLRAAAGPRPPCLVPRCRATGSRGAG